MVIQESWASLVKHVRDKVEDHYWEVDGLAKYYSVRELTFRIRRHPDDDPNEKSSSESDTTSDWAGLGLLVTAVLHGMAQDLCEQTKVSGKQADFNHT